MEISRFVIGALQTNCYLLESEKHAAIIDPAVFTDELEQYIEREGLAIDIVILTHAHFDHILGAKKCKLNYDCPVAIGIFDSNSLTEAFKDEGENHFIADILLKDGEMISIGSSSIKVIETPGHTIGSICLQGDGFVISGDTLFMEGIGRCDFPGGSFDSIVKSIKHLYQELDGHTKVYPGHGDPTTIEHEKKTNPYVRG